MTAPVYAEGYGTKTVSSTVIASLMRPGAAAAPALTHKGLAALFFYPAARGFFGGMRPPLAIRPAGWRSRVGSALLRTGFARFRLIGRDHRFLFRPPARRVPIGSGRPGGHDESLPSACLLSALSADGPPSGFSSLRKFPGSSPAVAGMPGSFLYRENG